MLPPRNRPLRGALAALKLGTRAPSDAPFRLDWPAQVDLPSDINQALHMIALPLPSKRSADGEAAPSHRARTASQKGEAHANASGRPKASGGVKGDSAKRRGTLQRCGQCVPCTRADCGQCQNCMDKPKFGGPGLRKQACEKKRCLTMTTRFATPSPPADAIASSNGIKSDSPTGAEKFVAPSTMFSSSLSQGMQGMASAWTLQLDQLQQLSHAGAAAPLPALRTGMASGLGYSLQGLESNGLLGGSFGAISGAMGSIGGLGNLGHGLGNLGNNGITLGEVPAPAAAHVSARHGASANAAPVASHVADGVPVFAYPAPRATHAPSQCPGFAPLGAEHPFVRRHPALEVPEDSFATADSFSTSLGFTDGVGSIGGSPRAEWDDGKSAADDNNDIVIEEVRPSPSSSSLGLSPLSSTLGPPPSGPPWASPLLALPPLLGPLPPPRPWPIPLTFLPSLGPTLSGL